jgi:hypothetical protein
MAASVLTTPMFFVFFNLLRAVSSVDVQYDSRNAGSKIAKFNL